MTGWYKKQQETDGAAIAFMDKLNSSIKSTIDDYSKQKPQSVDLFGSLAKGKEKLTNFQEMMDIGKLFNQAKQSKKEVKTGVQKTTEKIKDLASKAKKEKFK